MTILLVVFAVGTLLLRVGFAMLNSGSVRAKNSAGAVLRVVANTAIIALVFWAIGGAAVLAAFVIGSLSMQGRASTASVAPAE